ncbi:hypothetical protein WDJ51_02375 [Rathayibacter sp. YIM 133350]
MSGPEGALIVDADAAGTIPTTAAVTANRQTTNPATARLIESLTGASHLPPV